jgi:hypothetical protein|tara:strand:+ start:3805 stop:3990 length:186 start_codon:yes stop_codon:yes gene_type:complete
LPRKKKYYPIEAQYAVCEDCHELKEIGRGVIILYSGKWVCQSGPCAERRGYRNAFEASLRS